MVAFNLHQIFLTNHKWDRERTDYGVSGFSPSVLCPLWCCGILGKSWKIFFWWLQEANVRKCVIFVTIPPENKSLFICEETKIYSNTDDYIEMILNEIKDMYSWFEHNTEIYCYYWIWFYIFAILLRCDVVTAVEKKNTKGYKLIFPNVCCPLFTEHNTRILVINHIYLKKKIQYNTKIFSFLKAVTNIVQRWSSVMTFKYKIVMKSLLKNIKSNMNIWNFYGKNLLLTALANMYKKSENK